MSGRAKRTENASAAIVEGRRGGVLAIDDRGLAYGDGLFETIRFNNGTAPLWPEHMTRLKRGCRRLRLRMPREDRLWNECRAAAGGADGIVKIILTRVGGRGYAGESDARARRIVARYPMPEIDRRAYVEGVRLRWCRLCLAVQPALAGLKHLNRLEQVLARGEWTDPRIYDGLLCSTEGDVIGATSANVFVVRDGRLLTPRLDRCGIAGVARSWILAKARCQLPVDECRIAVADLDAADEVFLSNALRGIVPVRAIGAHRFAPGPVTRHLGYTLAMHGIGLLADQS